MGDEKDARIAELEREFALADGNAELGTKMRLELERERDEARAEVQEMERRHREAWGMHLRANEDAVEFEERAYKAEARAETAEAEVARLRRAIRGGTALNDTADLIEAMALWMIEHGAPPDADIVRVAPGRAAMLRAALAPQDAQEARDE